MQEFHLHPDCVEPELIQKIIRRLGEGEVGILPTDTVYGLMCLADNAVGRERIYLLKQRDSGKPLQYLIGSLVDIALLNVFPTRELTLLANRFWPGPLTIVIADNNGVDVGVRVPNHPFLLAMLRNLNKPLLATSANRSGVSPSISAHSRFQDLHGDPDFWVIGDDMQGMASTVVQLKNDRLHLLRLGSITLNELEAAIHER